MKKILQLLLFISLLSLGTGCASVGGYVMDRVHDAGDIANVSLGMAEGGGIRLGPLALGLGGYGDIIGLRRGVVGVFNPKDNYDVVLLVGGWEVFKDERAARRGKDFNFPESKKFVRTPSYWAHMTQVEVAGGLLLGARVGFNLAELLDFILGWTTLDILDDDRGLREKKGNADESDGSKEGP